MSAATLERAAARPRVGARWWLPRGDGLLFVGCFGLYLLGAIVLTWAWHIGNGDALARSANAWYVLFSRDPHLAAIGFVWPPLPSVLQLPLLPLLRGLDRPDLAGNLVSAAFGAGVAVMLSRTLALLGVTGRLRYVLVALAAGHLQMWYLSSSGLAEAGLIFFLAGAIYAYLAMPESTPAALWLGVSLACGVLVRYEALALVAAVPVAFSIQRWPPWHVWQAALEGRMLAALAAPVYAMALWVLWNWMVMGDPLYFQRSVFSLAAAPDVARNVGPQHPLYAAAGSPALTLAYVLERLAQTNVAVLVLLPLAAWIALRRADRRLWGLLILLGAIFAFTAAQVYLASLASWLRYWAFSTPAAVIVGGYLIGRSRGASRRWLAALVIVSLTAGAAIIAFGMSDPTASTDEQRLSAAVRLDQAATQRMLPGDAYVRNQHDAAIVAPIIDELSERGLVLLDTETAYPIILHTRHPERLAITSDRDFASLVDNPWGRVRFVLVTDPKVGGARDVVSQRFGQLFEGQQPGATLVTDVPGTQLPWRVYELTAQPR